jgi:hypothetical protein
VSAVDDFVWLRYSGGEDMVARFPADAAEAWQARGWEPCDPPLEDDSHLRDPAPPLPVLAEPAPADEAPIPKPARRRQTEET